MKNNYLIIFAVVAGFTGFLLGYSVPPIIEIGYGSGIDEVPAGQQDAEENQDLSDYYKQLQELQ